jgi:hypothetical protein
MKNKNKDTIKRKRRFSEKKKKMNNAKNTRRSNIESNNDKYFLFIRLIFSYIVFS